MAKVKVTGVQYKRNDDREIVYDYHRGEDGKRLEGIDGEEKYLQYETVEHEYESEREAAFNVLAFVRRENTDDVIVSLDSGDIRGQFAIAWAQRTLDLIEQAENAARFQPRYIEIKGKRYMQVD